MSMNPTKQCPLDSICFIRRAVFNELESKIFCITLTEEGQSRFISFRECLLGQVILKCHHSSGPAWRSSMMIGDIQKCNLGPLPAISWLFSLSLHFQFHLQFLLLSSCLAINLCRSLPLYTFSCKCFIFGLPLLLSQIFSPSISIKKNKTTAGLRPRTVGCLGNGAPVVGSSH